MFLFCPSGLSRARGEWGKGESLTSYYNQWRHHVVSERCVCWCFVSLFSWRRGVVHGMLEIACLGEALDRSCRRDVTNRQKLKRWTESLKTPFTPSTRSACFPVMPHVHFSCRRTCVRVARLRTFMNRDCRCAAAGVPFSASGNKRSANDQLTPSFSRAPMCGHCRSQGLDR